MGQIRPIPQVGQDGNPSKNTRLEITYGGSESPFGGVHLGPPPAYIDPKCFTDSNSMLVVDNKIVTMSIQPFAIPVLWNNTAGVVLLKIGTFYNSKFGQLNYALGFIATPETINGVNATKITFLMTSWNYNVGGNPVIVGNDTLTMLQYTTNVGPTQASLTIPIVQGESLTFADSGTIQVNFGVSGSGVGNATFGYTPGMTVMQAVTGIATALNAASGTSQMSAVPSEDGLSVVLTSLNSGAATNLLCVSDSSVSLTPDTPPAFYFPIPIFTFLQGGSDVTRFPPSNLSIVPSTTAVGGTLYISGFNGLPWILKYSGPGTLAISTTYQGAQVLKKFGGSLIAIGISQQLLNVLQNQDMIFSWSAAEDLDEWSPEDASGDVTGAGFAQLADIDDKLVGLVVSNNTSYIIRAQGLSYAYATGSGQQPYQFAHIGLGDQGEGCQVPSLVAQYDQTGMYVGNSNVFQISGSIGAIGDKIKSLLIPLLTQQNVNPTKSVVFPALNEGGDSYPLAVIIAGTQMFLYNTSNQTWMLFDLVYPANSNVILADVLFVGNVNTPLFQFPLVIATQVGTAQPKAFSIVETVPDSAGLISGNSNVTFPQEEVLFGRDVTIDAVYVSLWADIEVSLDVNIYINDALVGTLLLDVADPAWTSLTGRPTERQIYFDNTPTSGVVTSHSPQVRIEVPQDQNLAQSNQIRFAKVQLYCSFDPNQSPVG